VRREIEREAERQREAETQADREAEADTDTDTDTVAKAEASRQRQASHTGLQLAAGKSPTKAKCVVWLARGTHLRQGGQLAEVGQELGSGWRYT
jgi:hypothetical protein